MHTDIEGEKVFGHPKVPKFLVAVFFVGVFDCYFKKVLSEHIQEAISRENSPAFNVKVGCVIGLPLRANIHPATFSQ